VDYGYDWVRRSAYYDYHHHYNYYHDNDNYYNDRPPDV